MSFEFKEQKISELLDGDRRYQIPNFQRSFSWDNNNFKDFFNDLFDSSKFTFENLKANTSNSYFLGTILLIGEQKKPSSEIPYEVIDGQQRITTITLFYAAIQSIKREKGIKKGTDFGNRLFVKEKGAKSDQKLRLVNDSLNPVYSIDILDMNEFKAKGANPEVKTAEQKWIKEKYQYIRNNLLSKKSIEDHLNRERDKYKGLTEEEYFKFLEEFGNHLSNAKIIGIYHKERNEAHILFRNLNHRGRSLNQSDLIKNELFSLIENDSKMASSQWNEIDKKIFDAEESLQSFLYHYMAGRYTGVRNTRLFQKFTDNIKRKEELYFAFLNSLNKAADFYVMIKYPDTKATLFGKNKYFITDNNMSIKRDLEFISNIEIIQCRILLITLFECREKETINNKLFSNFVRTIALHECIHRMVKAPANRLNNIYIKFSKELLSLQNKADIKGPGILENFKSELINKLPEKESVKSTKLSYTGKPEDEMDAKEKRERYIIRYILYTVAASKQAGDTNRANDGLKFIYESTIEHIIDKENAIEGVYELGNLLPLERDIHKDVKEIEEKKQMYSSSKITLTQNFYNEYPDFNEEKTKSIRTRSKDLISDFYDIAQK